MHLGWYEIMDRVAMLQNSLEENVNKHHTIIQEGGVEFEDLMEKAQSALYDLYSYSGEKWYKSGEDDKENT